MMKKKMKTYPLNEVKDKFLGKVGTKKRDAFENELRLDLIAETIKRLRKEQNLTQAQLGKLVGVQKAQISKLENNVSDARFATILRVFYALKAKITFDVEPVRKRIKVA